MAQAYPCRPRPCVPGLDRAGRWAPSV